MSRADIEKMADEKYPIMESDLRIFKQIQTENRHLFTSTAIEFYNKALEDAAENAVLKINTGRTPSIDKDSILKLKIKE